jgi:hypothetical protein
MISIPPQRGRAAFTTTEVLIVVALSTVVIAVAVVVSQNVGRLLRRQAQWSEMQENLRIASDIVAADIRMAGYGFALPDAAMAQWITWVNGVTGRVNVVQGATHNDPDTLTLVGAFKGEVTQLTQAAAVGTDRVAVGLSFLDLVSLIGRPILIGRLELARVRTVNLATRQVIFTTDPAVTAAGLRHAYPAGTPVEPVEVVTFRCNTSPGPFPGRPYLAKDSHPLITMPEVQKMVAAGIEDMQVSQSSNTVTVVLRGRTRNPERGYVDPIYGDAYRRATAVVKAHPRNPRQ